jgi:LmbE family N-acetylglucosaminyl deacetylase
VRLSEIYTFAGTDVPDFVQKWSAPYEGGADLVLFATHGDDDQLYFAGLLPLYAKAKDCRVQVVYLTDHRNTTKGRVHEMINGLWAVGVKAYPVFGRFADFRIDDLEETYRTYESSYNTSREDLQSFVVEQIRRFKPQVAVGHDLKGEYGHGMHQVYADLLTKAINLTNDPTKFPESAQKYGTHQLSKLYLHLYKENPITIDYDQPMDVFNGLSAFQVTQKYGFPCHVSQQWTGFRTWLNGYDGEITKASQIESYNPSKFGLYYSAVGEDVAKNDFLENITTYAEQERLEQERLEQERLEQERLEQERLEQERLEQERLEKERQERERIEKERLAQELQRKKEITTAVVILVILVILLLIVVLSRPKGKKRKK